MTERAVDVVVIGAGAIGENVAGRAVRGGLSVVLVEAELVGGECSYWACMPSKALLRPGETLTTIKAVPGAAAAVTGKIDPGAVLAWRDRMASNWDDAGQVEWVTSAGIELVRGHARFTGERQVEIHPADGSESEGDPIRFRARQAVVVATGSEPLIPPVPGLAEAPYWTTRDATSTHEIPAELIILGGGVVGVELAQAFTSLGSQVTLIARSVLLGRHEPFAGTMLRKALEEQGVRVITRGAVSSVETDADGRFTVRLEAGTASGERLLVATGRKPVSHDLGLEQFGLRPGEPLEVDDSGRVSAVPGGWLYAAGDVNGRALLTHQGKYQARVVGDVIAARAAGTVGDEVDPWSPYAMTADHASVPQVVFTLPQVASVGLTQAEAEVQAATRGLRFRAIEIPIAVGGSSVHSENYTGRAVLVLDQDRQTVIGATFVGPDVADLLHSATIAVVGEVPLHRLWHAVPSYPTISEVWLRLLEAAGL